MDRALPGRMVDLIRDGVPTRDLKARGDRAVFQALVRTASSAHQRGWGRMEWEHFVMETRNLLGRQVRLKDGHRERSPKATAKTLEDAWDAAVVWVSEQAPAWDREQAAQEAQERAQAALEVAADADNDLTDAERAVLAHAAEEHDRRGMLQVAMPRAAVVKATGLGERTVRTALASLDRRGLLTVAVPGRAARTEGKRRATLYALAGTDALAQYLCRGTRPMGPPAQTYGTPTENGTGTSAQTYGTPGGPADDSNHREDPTMSDTLTLTLSDAERAAVLQTLAAMRAGTAAPRESTAPMAANVLPFRPAAGGAR